ncbi:MAG: amidohydrolase family protein [Planctomycetota bacterium]|jgi:imidazolonepropionase-like amidohydrolase
MLWRIIGTGLLIGVLTLPALCRDGDQAPESFAVKAGWIYTESESGESELLKNAVLWVRAGRIAAVGQSLDLPEDLPVLDFSREVIIPGLILADNALILSMGGKESVSAKYRALDGFDFHADHHKLLSGGVTAMYLNPGTQRLMAGQGAVVKVGGAAGMNRILKDGGDLVINLGERAFNPPPVQDYPLPASSATPIPPSKPQRPTSRLSQYEEIRAAFERARAYDTGRARRGDEAAFDYNLECLAAALKASHMLRIDARRQEDIEGAVRLLKSLEMKGYLTGALEAHGAVSLLKASGIPVVLEVPVSLNQPPSDRGFARDPVDARLETAAMLDGEGIPFALTIPYTQGASDLMLGGAAAVRGGLRPEVALAALTRVPARILGVSDRIGSLETGKDADFLVLSGHPFRTQTHVLKAFSSGREVFTHPASEKAMVVRAGKILPLSGPAIRDGAVLIEDGKISAVGNEVPHPPGARTLDAGPGSVLVPGFIDGHGHLGLEGDRSTPTTDISPARAVVRPGLHFDQVAAAGVTTVIMAPRSAPPQGAQVAAIKTAGTRSADMKVKELVGLKFSFRNQDPVLGAAGIKSSLKAGKDYSDKWIKYYEDLKKWEEEQAGKKPEEAAPEEGAEKKEDKPVVEEQEEEEKADPITGTWEYTVEGGPIPEPQQGVFRLKLDGNQITGTGSTLFRGDQEVSVQGTLTGDQVRLELDLETPVGKPVVEAKIDREDHMIGEVKLGNYFSLSYEAERTEKAEPVLKVTFKKKKTKDGRPEPPKLNEALEPYRSLMAGKAMALVDVRTAAEIEKVIEIFRDEFKVPLGLLGAEEAYKVFDRIKKAEVSVVLPSKITSKRKYKIHVLADELAREGIPIVFQSAAEDGARALPWNASYAVYQGLDPEEALKALTLYPAQLYKIDDRVGSLAPGRDADLIIFSGDPFELGSSIEHVIIDGREVNL